jgi:tetratricopeptide (TPR) repeat protein
MLPFYRSRAALIGLAIAVLLLGAIGFLPLFQGPGYESALAAGIILPFIVAVVTAREIMWARPAPLAAFWKGVENGLAFAAAAYLTTLAHGARVGFCDAASGSVIFALGPGVGAVLAGVWGAVAGEIAARRETLRARRRLSVALAILGPIASYAVSGYRFYTSPIVFAYDPFVGYFSGTLYDTIVDFSGLFTYRAGSAATLLCAGLAAAQIERSEDGRLRLARGLGQGRGAAIAVLALALAGSAAFTAFGDKLFHWQTPASIARALGAERAFERCDVVYPRGMDPDAVARFGRSCDAHVELGERWLGAPVPFRIKAYLFEDTAQKAALMGAANTYVAKPWRHELYVQEAGYPHGSLGHEVIHVLAGHFARGPFRVAGSVFGWLPDPGLIEGIAVAAAPPEGDLTPREWARAMKDLEILPPLSRLFALGFLGQNSATAYTVSGAFVGYVKERFGAEAVRAWYGGASLPEVTGVAWADLERAFHEDLDKVVLSEAARVQAKARFDRPAIFGRRCPRVVDACKARAEELKAKGDHEGAIEEYQRAMKLDPGDLGLRIAAARSDLRLGRAEQAVGALSAIADDASAPRHMRDRATEELGDIALREGRGPEAVERFRDVLSRTVSEDAIRTLEVKIAAASDARARPAVVALLIGDPRRGPDKVRAAELLGAWAASAPEDGLPHYLLGRHYFGADEFEEAAVKLDEALRRRLAVPRVQLETTRLRMVVACGLGDVATARSFFTLYASRPEVGEARRGAAESLIASCGGSASNKGEAGTKGDMPDAGR